MAMFGMQSEGDFLKGLRDALESEIRKEGERIIDEAVEQFRKDARRRLGEMVIGMLERSYRVDRMGQELCISVRLPEKAA